MDKLDTSTTFAWVEEGFLLGAFGPAYPTVIGFRYRLVPPLAAVGPWGVGDRVVHEVDASAVVNRRHDDEQWGPRVLSLSRAELGVFAKFRDKLWKECEAVGRPGVEEGRAGALGLH